MELSWPDVNKKPKIIATSQQLGDAYYTLVVFDPDAPRPSFLHYMCVNIAGHHMDTSKTCTVMPWMKPMPPYGETHKYIVMLFRQQKEIRPCPIISSRSNFILRKDIGNCIKTLTRSANANGFV